MCLAMQIKRFLFSILILVPVHAFAGDEFDSSFRCYRGDQVLLGLTRSLDYASVLIVSSKSLRVGNDVFCSSGLVGGCSVDSDGGHFEVLAVDDRKLTVDFNGEPKIVTDAGGSAAWIVPFSGAPERLVRMELKRVDNSLCKY